MNMRKLPKCAAVCIGHTAAPGSTGNDSFVKRPFTPVGRCGNTCSSCCGKTIQKQLQRMQLDGVGFLKTFHLLLLRLLQFTCGKTPVKRLLLQQLPQPTAHLKVGHSVVFEFLTLPALALLRVFSWLFSELPCCCLLLCCDAECV